MVLGFYFCGKLRLHKTCWSKCFALFLHQASVKLCLYSCWACKLCSQVDYNMPSGLSYGPRVLCRLWVLPKTQGAARNSHKHPADTAVAVSAAGAFIEYVLTHMSQSAQPAHQAISVASTRSFIHLFIFLRKGQSVSSRYPVCNAPAPTPAHMARQCLL